MGLAQSIGPVAYGIRACGGRALAVRETLSPDPQRPRLLDRVREALRARHYSRRTEKAYVAWVRRYILHHGKRHPLDMGGPEVAKFLTSLAMDGHVSASTQNQALSALLFLYRQVLDQELPWYGSGLRLLEALRRISTSRATRSPSARARVTEQDGDEAMGSREASDDGAHLIAGQHH